MRVDLVTRDGVLGYVDDDGPDSEGTARFLDTVAVPGGLTPDDGDAYREALFSALRGGSYLWAQPATETMLARVAEAEELLEGAAAAWDESRVSRYLKGTRVVGREGGGRFAPRAVSTNVSDKLELHAGDRVTVDGKPYTVDGLKTLPTGNAIYYLEDELEPSEPS